MWECSDGTQIKQKAGSLVITGTSEVAERLRGELALRARNPEIFPILVYVAPPPSQQVPLDPSDDITVDSWVMEAARLGRVKVITRPRPKMPVREANGAPYSETGVVF